MKVLILSDGGYMSESADKPEIGKRYILEDAITGTGAQRKTREALIHAYWKDGSHPKYGGDSYSVFRDQMKRTLGQGFASFVYAHLVDGEARIRQEKKYEDIPEYIRQDKSLKDIIQGKLKSCSEYTKSQNQKFIDNLITDMVANGVNSNKFQEIMEGLKSE